MKLTLSTQGSTAYKILVSCSAEELRQLKKFPGLLYNGHQYLMPAEPRVVYNLVNRLRKKFKHLELTAEVEEIYKAPLKLKDIPPDFKFYTEPKDFQRIALRYAYTVKGGGLLLEPGMGKTKVVLDYVVLMGYKKVIIVCPKPLLFVWQDERDTHRPDKTIYCVETTDWEKELPGIKSANIVVINYNKAVTFAVELSELGFDFIGIDEALIKEPKSQRTKALTWLGRKIPHRMLMSGTLVNNSPLDVYAPLRFLEPSLVGLNFENFINQYAVRTGKKDGDGNFVGPRFVVGYKNVPEIKSTLESVSIVMTKDEWLKLPKKKFYDVLVQPSDHQREVYNSMKSNYIANMWDKTVEVDNPLSCLTKLIQICNGFMYLTPEAEIDELDDSPPKKVKRETIYFFEQPKLRELIRLLKEDLAGRRVIVWYNMQAEGNYISSILEHEKIKFIKIAGGDKEVGDKVRLYNRDRSYQVLQAQAKSVNYGITVLGQKDEEADVQIFSNLEAEVYTQVFYSLNFSLEVYLQQQDRIHRLGQERECEYYHLITNLEAERYILKKLKEKMAIRGQVLEDVINMLNLNRDII